MALIIKLSRLGIHVCLCYVVCCDKASKSHSSLTLPTLLLGLSLWNVWKQTHPGHFCFTPHSQMAVKQGNQLQMQVHEGYHVVEETSLPVVAEKRVVPQAGKKPLAHRPSLLRVLGSDTKNSETPAAQVRMGWTSLPSFLFLHLSLI